MIRNLDRLKVFYTVYAQQSVGEAAKLLHVSQSAVSQSLQKLESDINTQLFTRLHRRMVPTLAGNRLFETVEPFLLNLEGCLKTIEQGKVQPFGALRMGAPLEFGKRNFPEIVAKFREQYPEVTISLTLGDQNELLSLLERGQLDFTWVDIFQNQRVYLGNLDIFQFTAVKKEEIILACSKKHYEMMRGEKPEFEQLVNQKFVAYRSDAQSVQTWFKHHFIQTNINIKPVFVIESHEAIVSAIKHHMGLGIVASHLVKAELESGQIVAIETDQPQICNQISLVQLQNKVSTLTEKVFLQFFEQAIE